MNRNRQRITFLASLATAAPLATTAVLTSCSSSGGPGVPDMDPIGSGLKFIGIGLVVMALVFVLAVKR